MNMVREKPVKVNEWTWLNKIFIHSVLNQAIYRAYDFLSVVGENLFSGKENN
jgi:hypothetical protein